MMDSTSVKGTHENKIRVMRTFSL